MLILAGEHPCNCFAFLWQLHTFWVENDNYFTVTKPWFASRIPFPLSLILPGRMSRGALNRILLTRGEPPLYHIQEVEAQVRESPSKPSREGRREGTGPYPRDATSRVSFILLRYTEMPRSASTSCQTDWEHLSSSLVTRE